MKSYKKSLATWAIFFVITVQSAFAADLCYVDGAGANFESTTGYRLRTARDGTVFTDSERRAFNLIAGMLPDSLKNLDTLGEFERVPDGYVIDGGAVGLYIGRKGRRYGQSFASGEIHLAQLSTQVHLGRFEGDFFETVIHEMTHALDYQLGQVSSQPEWRNLSTWNADGSGASRNFVSGYALSDSSEDFAESVATFVLEGDLLLKKAPTKFDWISKNIFNGARFDSETLSAKYRAILAGLDGEARTRALSALRAQDYYACRILYGTK